MALGSRGRNRHTRSRLRIELVDHVGWRADKHRVDGGLHGNDSFFNVFDFFNDIYGHDGVATADERSATINRCHHNRARHSTRRVGR